MLHYNVPDYRNSLEFLTFFAQKRGLLQKGALPNTEQAATVFLNDWTGWVGYLFIYNKDVPYEVHTLLYYYIFNFSFCIY